MSKFFRTGSSSEDSASSSEDGDEGTGEILNLSLSQLPPRDVSGASLDSIAVDRSDPNAQDFLVSSVIGKGHCSLG